MQIVFKKRIFSLFVLVAISILPVIFDSSAFAVSDMSRSDLEMSKIASHPRIMELLRAKRSDAIFVDERPNHYLAFASECSLRARVQTSEKKEMKILVSRVGCGSSSEIRHVRPMPKTWICSGSGAGQGPRCFRALKSKN